MLNYSSKHKIFYWNGPFETRHIPWDAGFKWSIKAKTWYTSSPYIAFLLKKHAQPDAVKALAWVHDNIEASSIEEPLLGVPAPPGESFFPFQAAGIEHMSCQLRRGRKHLLCADEQGLGKTIQAIGLANEMGYKKLLVICPASLRLNWAREINKWHIYNKGVDTILKGGNAVSFDSPCSIVTSYNLAELIKDYKSDFNIIDESHYIKNPGTKRTQLVLGDGENWRGFISKAPTLFLAGTPIPNGKPDEIWPLLYKSAPDVINYMKYWPFVRQFCEIIDDEYTGGSYIVGAKRTDELYARLRGSGFMIRRLKKDVLSQLPPKRYKMVIFPENAATKKVLKKEKPFNAEEILKHGVPIDSAMPEIRREMGIAKVNQCAEYITDMLDSGIHKVGVCAHHRDVCTGLGKKLQKYNPVVYMGGLSDKKKDDMEQSFQNDPSVRVFIGNEAAQEGLTLTAAHHVVDIEPEWVPGKNEQKHDRYHRITQTEKVLIHLLVVEGSLDAKILGSAAGKAEDIEKILGG